MGAVRRAVLNTVRKPARTATVVVVIGFAIAIFLTMSLVSSSIAGQGNFLSGNAANLIEIVPAGSGAGAFFGGGPGNSMSTSVLSEIQGTSEAAAIQPVVQFVNGTFGGGGSPSTFPTIVYGEYANLPLVVGTTINPTITAGRALNGNDASAMVAEVGSTFATDHSVSVGSTLGLNGTTVTVVGIFSTGAPFLSSSVVVPFQAGQTIAATSDMHEVFVTAAAAGDVNSVAAALQAKVGDSYEVEPLSSIASQIQSSLDSIYDSSQTGLYLSLLTGAVVMVFVMVLAMRERTKEIGVMKAIGFRNRSIITQFAVESMVVAVVGFGVGVGLADLLAPTISDLVLGQGGAFGGGPGGGGGRFGLFGRGFPFNPSPELIVGTLAVAVGLGVLGALYPIVRAIRLRPAEALRYE